MHPIVFINGKKESSTSVFNRNTQFGDGIFETGIIENNTFCFYSYHLKRLKKGCNKLKIKPIAKSVWLEDIKKALAESKLNDCIIKIILSRGNSTRGYSYNENIHPIRIIILSPKIDKIIKQDLTLSFCNNTYSHNPNLAGIKHCNRLEQILARSEVKKDEGIMLDKDNNVISVTQGNIFSYKNHTLYTPILNNCGILGTRRDIIIEIAKELNIKINISKISITELMQAEEIFISNSVMGIQSVAQINNTKFKTNKINAIKKAFAIRKNKNIENKK